MSEVVFYAIYHYYLVRSNLLGVLGSVGAENVLPTNILKFSVFGWTQVVGNLLQGKYFASNERKLT